MEISITRDDGLDPLDGTNGAAGTGDLGLFAEDLRTAFPETPLPERMAEDHIAAMIGAVQLLAEKGGSALEPTSNAHGPDRRVSGLPKLRRRTMKQRMILRLTVTAGMLVSLAGLANAGVLPDPIQGTVEDVLGIDEGDQANIDDGAVNDTDDAAVNDTDDAAVDDTDDAAVGDADEGAVGDADQGAVGDADQGAVDDTDEDAVDDTDEGAVGDVDDGAVDDNDDGAAEDNDEGAQEDADDGGQEDADDGGQEDADDGSQGNGDEGSNE